MGKYLHNRRDYLEIFIMIVLSVSPLISIPLRIFLCLFLLILNRHNIYISRGFLFLLLICFLIPSLIDIISHGDLPFSLLNISIPLIFLCGFVVGNKYSEANQFYYKFEQIVFYLALLSLVGCFIMFFTPSVVRLFPEYVMNDKTHHTIYFFNFLQFDDGNIVIRNSGLAWEPGVFQFLLNIALLVNANKPDSKIKLLKSIVYVLSICLTKSTMGYIIMLLVFFKMLKTNKVYILILIISFLWFLPVVVEEIKYQLDYKMLGSDSFGVRFEPMFNAINLFGFNIYGIGSSYYNSVYEILNIGSFDSYTQILLRYGYPLFIYIVYKLIRIWQSNKILGFIIILTFFSEPLWSCVLVCAMYFLKNKSFNESLR